MTMLKGVFVIFFLSLFFFLTLLWVRLSLRVRSITKGKYIELKLYRLIIQLMQSSRYGLYYSAKRVL